MQVARIISLAVTAHQGCTVSSMYEGRLTIVNRACGDLGATVAPADLQATLYPRLAEPEIDAAGHESGRLKYDSARILAFVQPFTAFAVAEREMAATLDQWMCRRQSVWRSRYQHMIAAAQLIKDASAHRIASLSSLLAATSSFLSAGTVAYQGEGMDLNKVARPTSTTNNRIAAVATRQRQTVSTYAGDATSGTPTATHVNVESLLIPATFEDDPANPPQKNWMDRTENTPTVLIQESVTEANEFDSPMADLTIRCNRMLADVQAELLEDNIFALRLPYLADIWRNELADLDLEIRKLQLAYLDSFLFPAVGGTVSAKYRRAGEYVRKGDAVMLVEDPGQIELSGSVRAPKAAINVGDKVKVKSANVFKNGTALELSGTICAIRGYDANSDYWAIVCLCANPAGGLTIGYSFESDPAVTSIEIG